MAKISSSQLKKEINDILKNADLTVISAKKVRLQLEKKLECDLLSRKKEIDALVMNFVNSKNNSEDEDDDEEDDDEESENSSESEEDEKEKNKRGKVPAAKKAKKSSSEEDGSAGSEDDGASDEEYSPKKNVGKSKKSGGGGKTKKESDSDSDEDWKKPPPAKKTKKAAAPGGKGKGTGFTRALTLSPELAALMGAESLPRHEVVKKMWAMIKERNLLDPKNKQFAICDNDLIKVMGVKRFRTFGMLKYLRTHFRD